MAHPSDNTGNDPAATELSESQLDGVQGGNSISIKTKMPGYTGPKLGAPGSIAQGDTLDNTLTENGLS
jgi:hypothetical protein